VLIVEVLSPSTERHDRGDKFEGYKAVPTFREYVLVEYRRREVELWRRDDTGAWTATTYGPDGDVKLDSLTLELPLDLIYEDSGL
jgi:Uma2 family endonuclease